jgi:ribosomal protein L11 methylase PrmA
VNDRTDPGSFRDPGGRVYYHDGRVLRAIFDSAARNYEAVRDSGFLAELVESGRLLASAELPREILNLEVAPAHVLEHPRLPFISYPYEWSFALLKRAALFHLDLQLDALRQGFTLSDATAYNVQFQGTTPVFIDHLSLRPYVEGEIWQGHRQFCMQFLNPLILWSRRSVSPNHWYRGSLEGISPEDLSPLLGWRHNLNWTVLSHVTGQAVLQRRAISSELQRRATPKPRLSRAAFQGMLEGLRSFIGRCEVDNHNTVWADYEHNNSYDQATAGLKRQFVADSVSKFAPRMVIDLGCNSGEYSEVALGAGAQLVVGFDFDHGALDAAYARAISKQLNLLPLWLDAANPSPSQGWAQAERQGLQSRANSDFVLALAFIHHIAIGRNVPLEMVVDWIISLGVTGVVEFPPKSDPMVRQLLANREDIFPRYTEDAFCAAVEARARIVDRGHVTENGRLLVAFDRRE